MRYLLGFLLVNSTFASSILLNTNGSGTPETLGLTFGTYAQGVSVDENTTLTQIGIWVESPSTSSADFQIWSGTSTTPLFSETQTVAASSGTELLLSDPLSFTLTAGNIYYFDVLGPYSGGPIHAVQDLGFIPGQIPQTQNNLTLVWPASPSESPTIGPGIAIAAGFTLPLELIGTQTDPVMAWDPPDAPEPATFGLIALGCAVLIFKGVRRQESE
jgi:hypothetical protein